MGDVSEQRPEEDRKNRDSYAIGVANDSYDWYKRAAVRARRLYKLVESAVIIVSASIPISALVAPGNSIVPGTLGGIVVVLSGMRGVFHWQNNYLRFSEAREAVEAERRLYRTRAQPYMNDRTRAQILVASISRIEQAEMRTWLKLASRPHQRASSDAVTAPEN